MTPSTSIGLASAKYEPKQRSVRLFFSGPGRQFAASHKFFPVLYVDALVLPLDNLRQAIDLYNPSKFSVSRVNDFSLEVRASTQADLVKLARLLESMFGYSAKPLEPERQFLLSKGWSYFDSFSESLERLPVPSLPDVRLDFLPDSLATQFAGLAGRAEHAEAAEAFARKIAYAHLLAIPFPECPDSDALAAECFLQNAFFRSALPAGTRGQEFVAGKKPARVRAGHEADSAGIDFSAALSKLFSLGRYNLGPDTLNCACCLPDDVSAKNLLPDSLVQVRFLSDGFYFQSFSDRFASDFHASRPGKENRLHFKLESALQSMPVGPFLRNQSASVPLPDALELARRGKAELLPAGRVLKWFCLRRESALARALSALAASHADLVALLAGREGSALSAQGLSAHASLATAPEHFYLTQLAACVSRLLGQVPAQLTDARSAFYFAPLAASVEALRSLTLNRFKEFALERGGKWLGSRNALGFFRHGSPWCLAKDFSARHSLPLASLELVPGSRTSAGKGH